MNNYVDDVSTDTDSDTEPDNREQYTALKAVISEEQIHQQINEMPFDPLVPLVIGEFTFMIIGKVILLGRSRSPYNGVIIQINGEYYTFYQSEGQCGLWRLCLTETDKPSVMYKGNDYIQSTCAHLLLQHYIFKFIHMVDFVVQADPRFDLLFHELVGYYCTDDTSIQVIVNDKKRNATNLFMNDRQNDKFNVFTSMLKDSDGNINYNKLPDYLSTFSVAFEREYTIVGVDSILFWYTFNTNDFRFDCAVKQVQLSREAPSRIINLYFLEVKISGDNPIIPRLNEYDVHLMPFLLTPNEFTINEIGLYGQFIKAFNFPNKLLDYDIQCTEEEQQFQCFNKYKYVGQRFRNLFPFKQLYDGRIDLQNQKFRLFVQQQTAAAAAAEAAEVDDDDDDWVYDDDDVEKVMTDVTPKASKAKNKISNTIHNVKDVKTKNRISHTIRKPNTRKVARSNNKPFTKPKTIKGGKNKRKTNKRKTNK